MARPLAFLGGIITLIGVVSSFFFGLYRIEIVSDLTNYIVWYDVFGFLHSKIFSIPISETIPLYQPLPTLIWGILILIGAMMCLYHKKVFSFLGSRFISAAIGAIGFNLFLSNPFDVNSGSNFITNVFWGNSIDNGGETILRWRLGIGFIFILVGGILGWIGSALPEYTKNISKNKKLIKEDSGNVNAWIELGNTYKSLKDHDEAIFCIRKAIVLYPHEKSTWNLLGELYLLKKKNTHSAEQCFKNAIEIDPHYLKAIKNLELLVKP